MQNKRRVMFLYLTVLTMYAGWAQPLSQDTVFNVLGEAMRTGESKKLTPYFSPFVDVSINGKAKTYNSARAELACHNFFQQYPCSGFSIIHTSRSKKELQYTIGQYTSGSNSYNVLIKTRKVNGQNLIYEISFIEE